MLDQLLVLGSASGLPTRRRFSAAYALCAAGKLFLLDCGAPASTLLYRYNLDPIDVQAVFLSHWHMDHVANLGLLLTQNNLLRRPSSLTVYGPRGTRGKIRRMLMDSFLVPEELRYNLRLINIQPGQKYKEALVRVTYFSTAHLEKPRLKTNFGRKAIACGMVVSGPGWRIVYSGDVSSPKELTPYVNGCDLLIHEMAHPAPEEVAEFAEAAGVPHVLASHLGPEFDEAPQKIVEAFSGRYSGRLTVAEDGTIIPLQKNDKADTMNGTGNELSAG